MPASILAHPEPAPTPFNQTSPTVSRISSIVLAVGVVFVGKDPPVVHEPAFFFRTPSQVKLFFQFRGDQSVDKLFVIRLHRVFLLFLKMPALPLVCSEPPLPPLMQIINPSVISPVSSLALAVEKATSVMVPPVFLYKPSIRIGPSAQMKFSLHFWGNEFVQ
jgi:hypothetical protein